MKHRFLKTALFATITMIAFALNSVFGRLAISTHAIDPASYTAIRLVSGAVMLYLLVSIRGGFSYRPAAGTFFKTTGIGALALFIYAVFLSFAYITIDTGIGALILFVFVQAVIIGYGLYGGERPNLQIWIGLLMAFAGFVYLVSPGLSAPDPLGTVLMALSGIAWAVYSLHGRGQANPLFVTARNFLSTIPFSIILCLIFIKQSHIEISGAMLAMTSGAVTSALGYALWYETQKELSATKSAILQLTVPALAAAGGIIWIDEPLTLRFIVSGVLILGGVALAIIAKEKTKQLLN